MQCWKCDAVQWRRERDGQHRKSGWEVREETRRRRAAEVGRLDEVKHNKLKSEEDELASQTSLVLFELHFPPSQLAALHRPPHSPLGAQLL